MLAAGCGKRVQWKLPFGEKPTPEMDRRCDKWMNEFFDGEDPRWMIVENMPKQIAPWIAARFLSATAIALGNMQSNPNPPDAEYLAHVLRYLVTDLWNDTLKDLWPGFSMPSPGGCWNIAARPPPRF